MASRALSFGAVAAAYERLRLGYPDELADRVLAYAGTPVRTALEVGAGTGKATRLFARRGIALTATEPDAEMVAELRKHVPDSVGVVVATFEDLRLDESFDLIYAAASMHWTRAEGRWERVARLLTPGGTFASFGGPAQLADPPLRAAVDAARAPDLGSDDVPAPDGTPADLPMQWPGTELERSDLFDGVRQVVIERRLVMTADDYIDQLSTISAYLELPEATRSRVFERIAGVLPAEVDINADITLHLARRV